MTGPGDRNAEPRPWPATVEAMLADAGHRGPATFGGRGIGLATGAERWTVGPATVYRFWAPALGPTGDAAPTAGRDATPNRAATIHGAANATPEPTMTVDRLAAMVGRLGDVAPFQVGPVLGRVDGDHDGRPASWLAVDGPVGGPGDRPENHPDPDDLVAAIGTGMRAMHELAPATLDDDANPGGRSDPWAAIVDLCRSSVEANLVDPVSLPPPYDRYRPERLLELVDEAASTDARSGSRSVGADSLVCCHGFATAARFVVDRGRFAGFDRIEAPLVADRHFDLAVLQQSVHHTFGPEAVFRLYEAYGSDPDLVLLDRYVLVSHLLGRSTVQPTTDTADR